VAGSAEDGGSAIAQRDTLAAFMDEEAEALARSAVDAYTRARAPQDADALLAAPDVAALIAAARAEAYPVVLTMIAETVEGVLAPHAADRAALRRGLMWTALKAFGRRPRPGAVSAAVWDAARAELLRWVGSVMLRMPKTTEAIADSFAGPLLAVMPVHDRLGRDDYALLRGALHVGLAAIADRFLVCVDAPALAAALVASAWG
jgi:hypothetical protein